jgi:hypothetical protein
VLDMVEMLDHFDRNARAIAYYINRENDFSYC